MTCEKTYKEKCEVLQEILATYTKENIAIAFSGGTDSSLLLKLAALHAKAQGTNVYAITAQTELQPQKDGEIARQVAKEMGVSHVILQVDELKHAEIVQNPPDRCYHCKHLLFSKIMQKAKQFQANIVMDGTNADDLNVYRPGLRAIKELGIVSPLKEAGFSKEEVRKLAQEYGISVAKRPAAPCLATRFPYGEPLTEEQMRRVEKGETFLKTFGFYNVRIRVHGNIARIEVDASDMDRLMEQKKEVTDYLKKLGYRYITLDLEGFRSGSMDENLTK